MLCCGAMMKQPCAGQASSTATTRPQPRNSVTTLAAHVTHYPVLSFPRGDQPAKFCQGCGLQRQSMAHVVQLPIASLFVLCALLSDTDPAGATSSSWAWLHTQGVGPLTRCCPHAGLLSSNRCSPSAASHHLNSYVAQQADMYLSGSPMTAAVSPGLVLFTECRYGLQFVAPPHYSSENPRLPACLPRGRSLSPKPNPFRLSCAVNSLIRSVTQASTGGWHVSRIESEWHPRCLALSLRNLSISPQEHIAGKF